MEYGIQMYSVRDITEKNMDGALKALAEMGYKFVEFAGFFGIPADEIKAMLDKYGLKVSGTHTGWQEIAEHYEETLAYHKAIGNTRIIVPGADLTTKAKLDAFIDMMNEFQPKLAAEGIDARVVSMPSTDAFDKQDAAYRESVLPKAVTARVAVEAGIADYWFKYVGLNGAIVGMTTFGESAPAEQLFEEFGFTVDNVVAKAKALL